MFIFWQIILLFIILSLRKTSHYDKFFFSVQEGQVDRQSWLLIW